MITISLRIPTAWQGRLNSALVRRWLADWQRSGQPLPYDPGAGHCRISLVLPAEAVEHLASYHGGSTGSSLRRLLAAHLGGCGFGPQGDVRYKPVEKTVNNYRGRRLQSLLIAICLIIVIAVLIRYFSKLNDAGGDAIGNSGFVEWEPVGI